MECCARPTTPTGPPRKTNAAMLRQMAAAGQTDTSLAAAHRFHTFQLERDFCLHRWAQSAAMADFAIRTPQLIPVTMEEGRALALAHAADGNWWRRVDMTTLSRLRGELDQAIAAIRSVDALALLLLLLLLLLLPAAAAACD